MSVEAAWTPKPGDVIYAVGPDVDDELPAADELRDQLARVVVMIGDELYSVSLAVERDGAIYLYEKASRNGEAVYSKASSEFLSAWPFDAKRVRPTLAEAVRARAEEDIAYYEERLLIARSMLALAATL